MNKLDLLLGHNGLTGAPFKVNIRPYGQEVKHWKFLEPLLIPHPFEKRLQFVSGIIVFLFLVYAFHGIFWWLVAFVFFGSWCWAEKTEPVRYLIEEKVPSKPVMISSVREVPRVPQRARISIEEEPLHGETLLQQDGRVLLNMELGTIRFVGGFTAGDLVYATRCTPSERVIHPLCMNDLPRFTGQPYQVIKDEDSDEMILTPINLSEVWNQVDSMNLKF